jgi:hypothetical protein
VPNAVRKPPVYRSGWGRGMGRHDMVQFNYYGGTYSGVGRGTRMWRITPTLTGWHLEFRDPGDTVPTNAGRHRTLVAAQNEANRDVAPRTRSPRK